MPVWIAVDQTQSRNDLLVGFVSGAFFVRGFWWWWLVVWFSFWFGLVWFCGVLFVLLSSSQTFIFLCTLSVAEKMVCPLVSAWCVSHNQLPPTSGMVFVLHPALVFAFLLSYAPSPLLPSLRSVGTDLMGCGLADLVTSVFNFCGSSAGQVF